MPNLLTLVLCLFSVFIESQQLRLMKNSDFYSKKSHPVPAQFAFNAFNLNSLEFMFVTASLLVLLLTIRYSIHYLQSFQETREKNISSSNEYTKLVTKANNSHSYSSPDNDSTATNTSIIDFINSEFSDNEAKI